MSERKSVKPVRYMLRKNKKKDSCQSVAQDNQGIRNPLSLSVEFSCSKISFGTDILHTTSLFFCTFSVRLHTQQSLNGVLIVKYNIRFVKESQLELDDKAYRQRGWQRIWLKGKDVNPAVRIVSRTNESAYMNTILREYCSFAINGDPDMNRNRLRLHVKGRGI